VQQKEGKAFEAFPFMLRFASRDQYEAVCIMVCMGIGRRTGESFADARRGVAVVAPVSSFLCVRSVCVHSGSITPGYFSFQI
jgi:hypothetical protein